MTKLPLCGQLAHGPKWFS